jgi:hypothetical protein
MTPPSLKCPICGGYLGIAEPFAGMATITCIDGNHVFLIPYAPRYEERQTVFGLLRETIVQVCRRMRSITLTKDEAYDLECECMSLIEAIKRSTPPGLCPTCGKAR